MKLAALLEESKVIRLVAKNEKSADAFYKINDDDNKKEITAKEAKKLKLVHKYTVSWPDGYGGYALKLFFSTSGDIWVQNTNPGYGHWLTSLDMKEKDLMKYLKKED